jgi:hypothetical protein
MELMLGAETWPALVEPVAGVTGREDAHAFNTAKAATRKRAEPTFME